MKIVGIKYLKAVQEKVTGHTGYPPSKPVVHHKKKGAHPVAKRARQQRSKSEDRLLALIRYRNSRS